VAGRQKATFQKRQKEMRRLEKQREKAAKRAARKEERARIRESVEVESHEAAPDERQM
jgi:hypothetical protein